MGEDNQNQQELSGQSGTDKFEIVKMVPCEIYSRVVGYFRPTNHWNKGKQEEFKERKSLIIPEVIEF